MADDASSKVPYLTAYGNIKKALDKITNAAVPPKFTQDFKHRSGPGQGRDYGSEIDDSRVGAGMSASLGAISHSR